MTNLCFVDFVECGLGVQDKSVVADRQITSGSYHLNNEGHSAKHARLFGTSGFGSWIGSYDAAHYTNGW